MKREHWFVIGMFAAIVAALWLVTQGGKNDSRRRADAEISAMTRKTECAKATNDVSWCKMQGGTCEKESRHAQKLCDEFE